MFKNYPKLFSTVFMILTILNCALASTSANVPTVINNGPVPPPELALTFDIEAPQGYLPAILDVLAEHNVKATFFMLGSTLDQEQNSAVPRIVSTGCELGNHSYSHPNFTKLSPSQMRDEIISGQIAIQRLAKTAPSLIFRPPYGDYDNRLIDVLGELGYTYIVLWNIDPQDWAGTPSETMAEHILQNAKPGSIILFHDFRPNTPAALKILLPKLKQKGFQFVTVSQLLGGKA